MPSETIKNKNIYQIPKSTPRHAVRVECSICGVIDTLPLYTNISFAIMPIVNIKTIWYKIKIIAIEMWDEFDS